MKKEVQLNIIYSNNTCDDKNYVESFINSIEDLFKQNGALLEAMRIAEAENTYEELSLIFNDEILSPTYIRLRLFKSVRKVII